MVAIDDLLKPRAGAEGSGRRSDMLEYGLLYLGLDGTPCAPRRRASLTFSLPSAENVRRGAGGWGGRRRSTPCRGGPSNTNGQNPPRITKSPRKREMAAEPETGTEPLSEPGSPSRKAALPLAQIIRT